MAAPLRVANCSGFYGDRLSAAAEMVYDGPIDVLTGDWLAELTMLILARSRAKRPGTGFARTFVSQMEQVMGTCLERGIKVVSNAGGLEPGRCAEAVAEVADRLGLAARIAYVDGDDLRERLAALAADALVADFETGQPLADTSRIVSANAYLGCFGIVEALAGGADVVVTGRVTDAALACGPAAWHHGWSRDDWDRLAGAVVAGHVIECGAQATGGNYSFFSEVAGMAHVGFPWVEIHEDGSSVVGKHDGTGGEVSIGTVTSQLLYEIGAPAYLGPDVTARFDTIQLEQLAADRVGISGVRGEPPPPTLKVAMNELAGYRRDLTVALTGLDIEAKALLVHEAFWRGCPFEPGDFEHVTTRVLRTDKADPVTNEEAVALWRMTLKDRDESKLDRTVVTPLIEMALATIPGFFSLGSVSGPATAFGVFRAARVAADLVPQWVTFLDGRQSFVKPLAARPPVPAVTAAEAVAAPRPDAGATAPAPFGRLFATRSGDKGGHANLGVFARSDDAWTWLDGFLTIDELRRLLPETAALTIERHRLANLRALNFLIHDLLGEGVAASTRQDAQAKGLGEWLRARTVELPVELLAREGARP